MTELSDRDIDLLLPFYVNGTLSAEETRLVEARLDENEALRQEKAYLEALRRRIQDMGDEDAAPGEMGLQRLKREIRTAGRGAGTAVPGNDNVASVSGWWRPLAIAACVALLVLSAVQISGQFGPEVDDGLQTARDSRHVDGPVLQIFFAADARADDIRQLLMENGLNIISGPTAAGFYRVAFTLEADADQVQTIISQLKARPAIEDIVKE